MSLPTNAQKKQTLFLFSFSVESAPTEARQSKVRFCSVPLISIIFLITTNKFLEHAFYTMKIFESEWFVEAEGVYCTNNGCKDLVLLRALASHQCGTGSITKLGVICGISLLVHYFSHRGFSARTPVFPFLQKPTLDLNWFALVVNFGWQCPQLVLQR